MHRNYRAWLKAFHIERQCLQVIGREELFDMFCNEILAVFVAQMNDELYENMVAHRN